MTTPFSKSERRHREAALRSSLRGRPRPEAVCVADAAWLETGKGYEGTQLNMLARAFAGFEKLGRAGKGKR